MSPKSEIVKPDFGAYGGSGVDALSLEGDVKVLPKQPVVKANARRMPRLDRRKFNYDVVNAYKSKKIDSYAPVANKMSPQEAAKKLDLLHEAARIHDQPEDVLWAFDRALFLQHAFNGASVAQPERGEIVVEAKDADNNDVRLDMADVLRILGVDSRRFFRAYADVTADILRDILEKYDPDDLQMVDDYGRIQTIAVQRGLMNYKYLIHDSADACVNLSPEEVVAVLESKQRVLTTSSNENIVTEHPYKSRGY